MIARVFNLKKKALIKEVYDKGIFGKAAAHVHTIEFQKRGLPHMHMLVFLERPHKILSVADVDSVASAAWPDPETQPQLFDTVQTTMVHGPCGALDPKAHAGRTVYALRVSRSPFKKQQSWRNMGILSIDGRRMGERTK